VLYRLRIILSVIGRLEITVVQFWQELICISGVAMSKQLSFRARALDTSKCMPVYKADEIPELPDFAAINRAVPQMPTGMEKEEETVISLFFNEF